MSVSGCIFGSEGKAGVLTSEITAAERCEDLQAQYGNDGNEEADAEHEGEEGFFALVKLQLGDDWQGKA